MKNKGVWVIGIIVLVAIIWISVAMQNQKNIKIGTILPLTGQISMLGEELRNGISLSIEDINLESEKKLEMIYEDSKLDSKEGILAVNRLINIENVKYIHIAATPIITAVQPITENKEVIITGTSIAPSILKDTDYTLRIFYNLEQALEKFVGFIDQKDYSKIAILYQNGESWERQVDSLEKQGIDFVKKESFNVGEKDFRTRLLKIKDSNPDMIIIFGYGSHFPTLFRQIEELGMQDIQVLGGLDFLEVPQENLNLYKNVVFVTPSFNLNPTEKSQEFIKKYTERFGKIPTHQAAYAYDAINLYYLGLINTDGSSEEIMNYLKNLSEYQGVVGEIEILQNGDTKSSLSFAQYKNGKISAI